MAVGMAMAFKHQVAVYDSEESSEVFNRRVWVICSDGDLQEGISYEAGALAGRQQLDNLTVIYDDNDIQIEGSTSLTWMEDVPARFAAQGWRGSKVLRAADGDIDVDALQATLDGPGDGRRRGSFRQILQVCFLSSRSGPNSRRAMPQDKSSRRLPRYFPT